MDIYNILTADDWKNILKIEVKKYKDKVNILLLKNPLYTELKQNMKLAGIKELFCIDNYVYNSIKKYMLNMDNYVELEERLIEYFGLEKYREYEKLQRKFIELTNNHPIKKIRSYFNLTQIEIGNLLEEKRGTIYFFEKTGVIDYDRMKIIVNTIRKYIFTVKDIVQEEIRELDEKLDTQEVYLEIKSIYTKFKDKNLGRNFNKKIRGIIKSINLLINVEIEDIKGFKLYLSNNLINNQIDYSDIPKSWKDMFQVIYILFRMLFQSNKKSLSSKGLVIKSILNYYINKYKVKYKGVYGRLINNFQLEKLKYLKKNPIFTYREYHRLSRNEFSQMTGVSTQEIRYIENFNDYKTRNRDKLLKYISKEDIIEYENKKDIYLNELTQLHIIYKIMKKHKLSMMKLSIITNIPISNMEHYIKQFQIPSTNIIRKIIKSVLKFEKNKKKVLLYFCEDREEICVEDVLIDLINILSEYINGNKNYLNKDNRFDNFIKKISDIFYFNIPSKKRKEFLDLFFDNVRESNISEKYIINNYKNLKLYNEQEKDLLKINHPYNSLCNYFGISISQLAIILETTHEEINEKVMTNNLEINYSEKLNVVRKYFRNNFNLNSVFVDILNFIVYEYLLNKHTQKSYDMKVTKLLSGVINIILSQYKFNTKSLNNIIEKINLDMFVCLIYSYLNPLISHISHFHNKYYFKNKEYYFKLLSKIKNKKLKIIYKKIILKIYLQKNK